MSSSTSMTLVDSVRREADNLLAIRRAASVAEISTNSRRQTLHHEASLNGTTDGATIERYVELSMQWTRIHCALLDAELSFLDKMETMDRDDKIEVLFGLLDRDLSGTLDKYELAEGIRKMNDLHALSDVMPLAERLFERFDTERDGSLTEFEFCNLLLKLCETMQCTLHELCQLMVTKIAFAECGKTVLEESLRGIMGVSAAVEGEEEEHHHHDEGRSDHDVDFDEAVTECRLIMLFGMFDKSGSGKVDFLDVVNHIFHECPPGMEALKEEILGMVTHRSSSSSSTNNIDDDYETDDESRDGGSSGQLSQPQAPPRAGRGTTTKIRRRRKKRGGKSLTYPEFVEFVLSIVAAFPPGWDFHDVANAMTLSYCYRDEKTLGRRFMSGEALVLANNTDLDSSLSNIRDLSEEEITSGRLTRLFDLWDTDHDGSLDLPEFVSGMRKFERRSSSSSSSSFRFSHTDLSIGPDTLTETLNALHRHDENHDNVLDRREFANLLQNFATAMTVDLHQLIDYMVVQSALRDTTAHTKEMEYIEAFTSAAMEVDARKSMNGSGGSGGNFFDTRTMVSDLLKQSSQKLSDMYHARAHTADSK